MTNEETAVLEAVEQAPAHVLHIHEVLVGRGVRRNNVAGASTLYRVVRGLERAQLLSSTEEDGDESRGARPRIIYTLTDGGRGALAEARKPLPTMTDETLAILEQLAQAVREGRENPGELCDHLGAGNVLSLIARVRRAEDTVRKLRGRGGILANLAFNLKQLSYVPEPMRESLTEAQAAWDAAVREAMEPHAGGKVAP